MHSNQNSQPRFNAQSLCDAKPASSTKASVSERRTLVETWRSTTPAASDSSKRRGDLGNEGSRAVIEALDKFLSCQRSLERAAREANEPEQAKLNAHTHRIESEHGGMLCIGTVSQRRSGRQ